MSLQPKARHSEGTSASDSQFLSEVWAYMPAGEACVTRVVVTKPENTKRILLNCVIKACIVLTNRVFLNFF